MAKMFRDDADRFVNPVTLTTASGSYIGTSANPLIVTGSLSTVLATGDIQIGAVELKNATTDDRATINTGGYLYVSSSADARLLPSANTDYAYDFYVSSVFESGSIVKASAGVLYGFSGYNSASATQFIQVHNSATQPSDGDAPVTIVKASATSNFSWDPGRFGAPFATGIVITNSSVPDTLVSGSNDTWYNITYK